MNKETIVTKFLISTAPECTASFLPYIFLLDTNLIIFFHYQDSIFKKLSHFTEDLAPKGELICNAACHNILFKFILCVLSVKYPCAILNNVNFSLIVPFHLPLDFIVVLQDSPSLSLTLF